MGADRASPPAARPSRHAAQPAGADSVFPARQCPVIVGPTAVGKTELVLRFAAEFPVEVISLDSRQIYRGLRIGTAQPTAAERAVCAHHLVDFLPPGDQYSAQRFRQDFEKKWQEIDARGRLPLLVGGAGFYLRALTEGFFQLPDGSDEHLSSVRDEIATLSDSDLADELGRVDPAAAGRLHPHDRYRRTRALEIYRLAGRSASELAADQRPNPVMGLRFAAVRLTRPTAELDRRIRARTAAMLDAGWIEETRRLLARHPRQCPGLQSLGYAEIVRFLHDEVSEDRLYDALTQSTRQYAKRQRTWFAKEPAVVAGSPQDTRVIDALRALIRHALGRIESA